MNVKDEEVGAGARDRVARDGFAAIAVLVLTVVFIVIVVSQIV